MADGRGSQAAVYRPAARVPVRVGQPAQLAGPALGRVAVVSWLVDQPGDTRPDRGDQRRRGSADWRQPVTRWRPGRAGASQRDRHSPASYRRRADALLCGNVIRPGAGWLPRRSPTPRNLAAERAAPGTLPRSQNWPRYAGLTPVGLGSP